MWPFKKKYLTSSVLSVVEHLKDAKLLETLDLKEILKHTEINVKKDGSATIKFSQDW